MLERHQLRKEINHTGRSETTHIKATVRVRRADESCNGAKNGHHEQFEENAIAG
jgi:hypothetical protein